MKALSCYYQFIFTIGFAVLGLCSLSQAGTVTKNTDQKVIIDFEGEETPSANDRVYILDQSSHKEIGLVEIVKTKGSRALGKILKGNAKPGDTTDLARSKSASSEDREPAGDAKRSRRSNRPASHSNQQISYGVAIDFIYTSIYLKNSAVDGSGSVNGYGFGLKGALDLPLDSHWALLSSFGLHPLNAAVSTGGFEYKVSTNYLALDSAIRFILDKKTEGLWLGGGLAYMIPMSSNLDPKPKSELTFKAVGGFNIRLGDSYFALKGEYLLFQNKSETDQTAQTSQITLGGVYFF